MDRRRFLKSTAAVVAGATFGFSSVAAKATAPIAAKAAVPIGGELVPRIIAKNVIITLKEESLIRGGVRLIPFSELGFDPLALLGPMTESKPAPSMSISVETPIVDASEFESFFGSFRKVPDVGPVENSA